LNYKGSGNSDGLSLEPQDAEIEKTRPSRG
jgi:hypothetical protein